MRNFTRSITVFTFLLAPSLASADSASLVDVGVGAQGGYGKFSESLDAGFTWGFDATLKLTLFGLGAFYQHAPTRQAVAASGSSLVPVDRSVDIVGGALYFFSPWPIDGFRLGLKAGSATASAQSIPNQPTGVPSQSAFVAGPTAGFEFAVSDHFSAGIEGDFLSSSTTIGGNLTVLSATLRFWL